ncbi:TPA: hypothetical protein RQJ64_004633 [Vibrio vulnificus]|nr:hypothetical protein [Vibrio vulnificus]HDY7507607.1 hypothetical protein [Vibrio vulnificus]
MVNLSEEKKKTLRAEESYRLEIRRELEVNTSSSLLLFFNTPLGIWLLTVAAIGLLSFGYFSFQGSLQSHNLNSDNTLVIVGKESLDAAPMGHDVLQAVESLRKDIGNKLEPKATNSVLNFLNSPLGIWLLSSGLVGILTFSYKLWQDSRNQEKLRQEEILALIDEGNFRTRQLDRTIEVAVKSFKKIESRQDKEGAILGSEFNSFIESAKLITVTIELGGILSVPYGENDYSHIGSSGYGLQHLLYKRSSKKDQYVYDSLLDLAKRLARLSKGNTGSLSDLEENFDCLEALYSFDFKEILDDWLKRHNRQGEYESIYKTESVYDTKISDHGDKIKDIGKWIYNVQNCWQAIKSNKLMELMK